MHVALSIVLVLVFNLLSPLGFLAWCIAEVPSSRIHLIAKTFALAGVFVFAFLAGRWDWICVWLRYALIGLLLLALPLVWLLRGASPILPTWTEGAIASFLLHLLVAGIFLALVVAAISGHRHVGTPVHLLFPLPAASWYITQGGTSALLNSHHHVHAQLYALDIVVASRWGARARGLYPRVLTRYRAYDAMVAAPCTGKVVCAVDGLEDRPPGLPDPDHLAGNHVAIYCEGATIVLAHLRRGSVVVTPNTAVKQGQVIGRVGNSGNSSEPHLHLHAVRGETSDVGILMRAGTPVPMLFDGKFLVRNSHHPWGQPRLPTTGGTIYHGAN